MSYSRKFHSQAGIPFSWEDKPGISKFALKDLPMDAKLHALKLDSPLPVFSQPSFLSESAHEDADQLPLPPCRMQSLQRVHFSSKGFRLKEDPFFAAYEECTRSVKHEKISCKTKTKGIGSWAMKKRFGISCKKSCTVRDDNFIRLSKAK